MLNIAVASRDPNIKDTHLRSVISPSMSSPSFKTYSLSLLLRASRICRSTSALWPLVVPVGLSGSPLSASASAGGVDRFCGPSTERGEFKVLINVGTTGLVEIKVAPMFVAVMVGNESVGDEMQEMGAEAGGSVAKSSEDVSIKPRIYRLRSLSNQNQKSH